MLDSTPSTGFQWQGPPNVAPALSPIQPRAHQTRSAGGGVLGATGRDVFRYRAEQPGKVTLSFDYRRVWEMIPPQKSVKYEITVE
jgi:predicted secreted protein